MITSEGIIGKVVTLIVDKSIGKLIDLPLDKRRKACRALTKLYYCIQALDEATDEFYRTYIEFELSGDAVPMVHALNNNSYKFEIASNMFIDLGSELYDGLEIIDPVLAKCCNSLYVLKGGFLAFMSNSIEWDHSGETNKILVKTPPEEMLSVNIQDLYAKADIALKNGDKHYWPSSALDDYHENMKTVAISFDDPETAKDLKEYLDKHCELLKSAKESLRVLLKDNFSIEEILFENDSNPWANS